jgi:hypothetical protein
MQHQGVLYTKNNGGKRLLEKTKKKHKRTKRYTAVVVETSSVDTLVHCGGFVAAWFLAIPWFGSSCIVINLKFDRILAASHHIDDSRGRLFLAVHNGCVDDQRNSMITVDGRYYPRYDDSLIHSCWHVSPFRFRVLLSQGLRLRLRQV